MELCLRPQEYPVSCSTVNPESPTRHLPSVTGPFGLLYRRLGKSSTRSTWPGTPSERVGEFYGFRPHYSGLIHSRTYPLHPLTDIVTKDTQVSVWVGTKDCKSVLRLTYVTLENVFLSTWTNIVLSVTYPIPNKTPFTSDLCLGRGWGWNLTYLSRGLRETHTFTFKTRVKTFQTNSSTLHSGPIDDIRGSPRRFVIRFRVRNCLWQIVIIWWVDWVYRFLTFVKLRTF